MSRDWRISCPYFKALLTCFPRLDNLWFNVDKIYGKSQAETEIDNSMLDKLPLFIKATLMESIVDAFEVMRNNGEEPECDEELSYLIKCLEDDIPYKGFFHEIYSWEEPFEYEERNI
jgi:hypothetical protein